MPYSGVNSWGPYTTPSYDDSLPVYSPTATPSEPGIPPQSPSGSVTGQAATWNYANDSTSTEEYLTNVIEVDSAQQGHQRAEYRGDAGRRSDRGAGAK